MPERLIENTIPIVGVASVETSVEHYGTVLGFNLDWNAGSVAGVSRDGHGIYLSEDGHGQPGTWVWVGVENLDAIHAEYTASGANITMPPTDFPHAREFHVADPDGNVLRFGGAPATGTR